MGCNQATCPMSADELCKSPVHRSATINVWGGGEQCKEGIHLAPSVNRLKLSTAGAPQPRYMIKLNLDV